MFCRGLVLIAIAILCGAASPPKPAAPKAAAKPPAQTAFDARDPAALVALLAAMDAKAQVTARTEDSVALRVDSPAGAFAAQFADCGRNGRDCQAILFDATADSRAATLPQLNAFNQTALACRAYQDRAGKAHVLYSALLFASDTAQEMRTHVGAWQGCLATFGEFLKDPSAYLATAP